MPAHAPADTDRLLDLLREAGDEAVTLDELAVVGVQDPASALLSLELAGFGVERIYERARHGTRTCVRLRAEPAAEHGEGPEAHGAERAAAAAPAAWSGGAAPLLSSPASGAAVVLAQPRRAAAFALLAVLLLLVARR